MGSHIGPDLSFNLEVQRRLQLTDAQIEAAYGPNAAAFRTFNRAVAYITEDQARTMIEVAAATEYRGANCDCPHDGQICPHSRKKASAARFQAMNVGTNGSLVCTEYDCYVEDAGTAVMASTERVFSEMSASVKHARDVIWGTVAAIIATPLVGTEGFTEAHLRTLMGPAIAVGFACDDGRVRVDPLFCKIDGCSCKQVAAQTVTV